MSIFDVFNKRSNPFSSKELTPQELYEKLFDYYTNNELYTNTQAQAYYGNTWVESMKPIRTVVNRSVEFYVNKVLPGDDSEMVISTENESVKQSIEKVWTWSNFSSQKQKFIRYLALFGDLFIKVVNDVDKVYFSNIEPKHVTDFSEDERGYLTSIRMDIPVEEGYHVEYWTKDYYASWVTKSPNMKLEDLGTPKDYAYLPEFGIDFIPIVHIKFRDIGKKRGASCVQHALDKIDESNREATRLSQLLFRYNKPIWAVSANSVDGQGRPIPAPKLSTSNDDMELKDNAIVYLPGNAKFESLIPDINYSDALNVLNSMMEELEKDLPELRYYSIQDSSISGKAIKLLLGAALDKAIEARGNFVSGLIRLDEIALTLGKFTGLFGNIGIYESGDFAHTLIVPDIFPQSKDEIAQTVKTLVEAQLPLASALRICGFSDEEISRILEDKQAEDLQTQTNLATSLINFNQQ